MSKPTKSVQIAALLKQLHELSPERLQEILDYQKKLAANPNLDQPPPDSYPELNTFTSILIETLTFSHQESLPFLKHEELFDKYGNSRDMSFDSEINLAVLSRALPASLYYTSRAAKNLVLLYDIYQNENAGQHALNIFNLNTVVTQKRQEMEEKAKEAAANVSSMLATGNQEQIISAFIELGKTLQSCYPGKKTEFIQNELSQIPRDSKKIVLDTRSFKEFSYIKEAVFLAASNIVEEYGEDSEHTAIVTWLDKGLSCYDIVANVDLQTDHAPEKTTIEENKEIEEAKKNIFYITNLEAFKKSCEELMQYLRSFFHKKGINAEKKLDPVAYYHLLAGSDIGSNRTGINITREIKHAAASYCAVYYLKKELIAPSKSAEERLRNFCKKFNNPKVQAELSINPDVKVKGFYNKMSEWVKDLIYKLLPSRVARCVSAFRGRSLVNTFIKWTDTTLGSLPIVNPTGGAPCPPLNKESMNSSTSSATHTSRSPSPTTLMR